MTECEQKNQSLREKNPFNSRKSLESLNINGSKIRNGHVIEKVLNEKTVLKCTTPKRSNSKRDLLNGKKEGSRKAS